MLILYSILFALIFAIIDGYQNRQTDTYRPHVKESAPHILAEYYGQRWHVWNLIRNAFIIACLSRSWQDVLMSFAIFLLISDGIINLIRGYDISFVGTVNNKYDTDRFWIWLKGKGINQYWVKGGVFIFALGFYFGLWALLFDKL